MPAARAADESEREPESELLARFEAAGQGHVFRFLPGLGAADRAALLADARSVDVGAVARLAAAAPAGSAGELEPPGDELVRAEATDDARRARDEAHDRGVAEIRAGRAAVVVVAGGQGTRLGSTTPKAAWPAGPVSGKPLLRWHAEKVLHWSRRTGTAVPLVVLVSDATEAPTAELVRAHGRFGLGEADLHLVRQGSLPAVDDAGRILLASPSRIALAPNGHGGLYAALRDSGVLARLAARGVRTLMTCQVDNPLVRTLDPEFLGFHAARGSQFSSKSVAKRSPEEKVGVFARRGGRPCVVEYSEMSDAQCRAADARGGLLFGQGNIAAHCIDVTFALATAERGLPFHRARKKVPHVDERGVRVEPREPNATKFESFVFDALPLAERSLVLETSRAEEFSPIKNAEGEDSPATARRDLLALFRAWHRRAGLPEPPGDTEVDPLVAPDERAFRASRGLPWR